MTLETTELLLKRRLKAQSFLTEIVLQIAPRENFALSRFENAIDLIAQLKALAFDHLAWAFIMDFSTP